MNLLSLFRKKSSEEIPGQKAFQTFTTAISGRNSWSGSGTNVRPSQYVPFEEMPFDARSPLYDGVPWPPPPEYFTQIERIGYMRFIKETIKDTQGSNASFYICALTELKNYGLVSRARYEMVYEYLRPLHCVRVINIPPDVREEINILMRWLCGEGGDRWPFSPPMEDDVTDAEWTPSDGSSFDR